MWEDFSQVHLRCLRIHAESNSAGKKDRPSREPAKTASASKPDRQVKQRTSYGRKCLKSPIDR
eukprot:5727805-Pleurochrysis_carterae.AAC.1